MSVPDPARRDRRLLLAAAALRATAVSLVGVLLGLYLARLGLEPAAIGAISACGLGGAAAAVALVAWGGDRWGRRRTLLALTLVAAAGGGVFLAARAPLALAGLAFVAMLNAMGRDRGAASVLEQATLPATVTPQRRTLAFAWYTALQDGGHALGSLLAGLAGLLAALAALDEASAARWTLALAPVLLLATLPLYARLSPRVESGAAASPRLSLSPGSRRIVTRISALFALDGIGGGLLVTALLSYFFFERFAASTGTVAALFFAGRLANVASHFGAAALARRIGLVRTMVFTHLPSSLLLVAVAFVDSFALAAALFLLRECLVEMDVPTRQSYVMAVVAPGERTAVSGIVNLVRLATWAVGPLLAGALMQRVSLGAPLLLGAGLKILYDLLLWLAFRAVRPPEEERVPAATSP